MISIAAAITIPVTNAVKQENYAHGSLPMRAMLFPERSAHLYRGGKVI